MFNERQAQLVALPDIEDRADFTSPVTVIGRVTAFSNSATGKTHVSFNI